MTQIHHHRYDNGLTLLVEPLGARASVGLTALLPAGVAHEPAEQAGVAAVLSEVIFRGAGDRDARAHSEALDQLGVQRSASVRSRHLRLGATVLGDRFDDALPLLIDMLRAPALAESSFGPARDLAVGDVDALEDDPQHKVMLALKAAHLPPPFGRSTLGRREALLELTNAQLRAYHAAKAVPAPAIIGVAGAVAFEHVRDRLGELLGDWSGRTDEPTTTGEAPRGYRHIQSQSAQHHIGVAYDAPAEADDDSVLQHVATALLAGGMGARLFTEVREKRGLCYAVHASYASLRDRGMVVAYAGTTPQRAAQTLEVMTTELRRLADGAEPDEFDRAVVGLKTRLVMQGESSSARAAAIADDQHLLGRPRTLDEQAGQIDAVTLDRLNDYLKANRPEDFTTLTIGPEALR